MNERGFTLLEVLVALAVLGSVLATVFGVFSSGLRSMSQGDDRLTLALIAESLLNRADLDLLRTQTEVTGSMPDGVSWRVTRRAYEPALARQGLEIEEPPRRRERDENLLPPEDGEQARGGLGREDSAGRSQSALASRSDTASNTGRTESSSSGFGRSESSSSSFGSPDRSAFSSSSASGERREDGSPNAVRLKAWLLTAEVANQRGGSFALSRLSLEGSRQTPAAGEDGRSEAGRGADSRREPDALPR
jgi:prepilin-type N-terminal cleavage/methylation domain-containing protein